MKLLAFLLLPLSLNAMDKPGSVYYESKGIFLEITEANCANFFPKLTWIKCKRNYPALSIKFMGNEVGHGVFAFQDIKKGEPVCEYVGEVSREMQSGNYVLAASDIHKQILYVNAEQSGGVGRFIQHAPKNLANFTFHVPGADFAVAIENLELRAILNPEPRLELYASQDIPAGDMLVYNYGEKFWFNNCLKGGPEPVLFIKNGEICPKAFYQAKEITFFAVSKTNVMDVILWRSPFASLYELAEENQLLWFGEQGKPQIVVKGDEILKALSERPSLFKLQGEPGIVCAHCKTELKDKLRCAQCKTIHYCNRDCQKAHWPTHKNSCGK